MTTIVGELPVGAVAAPLGDLERGFASGEVDLAPMTIAEWEALRIEAAEPVMDRDVDEKTIPQETGLVAESVSFEKGCYLGQELVARIDSRNGRVNHVLRRVVLDGPIEVPAEVVFGEESVGSLTSTGFSEPRHSYVGLGLLHRSVEPGDTVAIGPVKGTVDA